MKRIGLLMLVVSFGFVFTAWPQGKPQPVIITFDVPVADEVDPYNGTWPCCINAVGTITGIYFDANGFPHGFVRAPNGDITPFDFPGDIGIFPVHAINDSGIITGNYYDSNNVPHGFLRTPDGNFVGFDDPNAAPGGTNPRSINVFGVIAGDYVDENIVSHGFIRTRDGIFTTIDAPGAGATPGTFQGTFINTINVSGALSGGYVDSAGVGHQFVLSTNGKFDVYNDAPGAAPGLTFSMSITPATEVTGFYYDANNLTHGFVRSPSGKIVDFDAPGAAMGTYSDLISQNQSIVGYFADQDNVFHGFLRAPNGEFVTFDAPVPGIGSGQGVGAPCFSYGETFYVPCVSYNLSGTIAGAYQDGNNVLHGFIRLPKP
jgi:hypothetical protein